MRQTTVNLRIGFGRPGGSRRPGAPGVDPPPLRNFHQRPGQREFNGGGGPSRAVRGDRTGRRGAADHTAQGRTPPSRPALRGRPRLRGTARPLRRSGCLRHRVRRDLAARRGRHRRSVLPRERLVARSAGRRARIRLPRRARGGASPRAHRGRSGTAHRDQRFQGRSQRPALRSPGGPGEGRPSVGTVVADRAPPASGDGPRSRRGVAYRRGGRHHPHRHRAGVGRARSACGRRPSLRRPWSAASAGPPAYRPTT